jgi:rubrerythrin
MSDALPENMRLLFKIFKQAVEAEREAQNMYQEAMFICEDEKTKAAFRALYEDEVRHEQEVMDLYTELRSKYVPKPE